MSRIGLRIVAALLVVSLFPLLVATLTFRWVMEESLELGVRPEVEEALEAAAAGPRRVHEALSRQLAAAAARLAAGLGEPGAAVEAELARALEGEPRLAAVGAEDGGRWLLRLREGESLPGLEGLLLGRLAEGTPGVAVTLADERFPGAYILATSPAPGRRAAAVLRLESDLRAESERLQGTLITYRHLHYLLGSLRQRVNLFFFLVVGLAGLASLGAGLGISRGLTRRLALLSRATERLAAGELAPQLPPGGRDELGRLIDAFTRMAGELRQNRERIVYLEKMALWKDMARRLAHEIKNPLSPIQMVVQELRDRYRPPAGAAGEAGGPDPYGELLEESGRIVGEETGRLRRMVDAFSAFARLPEPAPEPLELNEAIGRFFELHPEFGEVLDLRLDLAPGLPRILFDPDQLAGILRNLAENAVQLGVPRLPLTVGTRPGPGGRFVEMVVEDGGPGIPDELKEKVFEPSFTSRRGGMGLGLAIVKKSVLDQGGWVRVEDARPRGARFVFRLPVDGGGHQ